RLTRHAPMLTTPEGLYDEFAARFPYYETEDQENAIEAVRSNLGAGRQSRLAVHRGDEGGAQ
ncbi:hypothetical protein ACC754_42250, partial [Rhizobium johnstonii]